MKINVVCFMIEEIVSVIFDARKRSFLLFLYPLD